MKNKFCRKIREILYCACCDEPLSDNDLTYYSDEEKAENQCGFNELSCRDCREFRAYLLPEEIRAKLPLSTELPDNFLDATMHVRYCDTSGYECYIAARKDEELLVGWFNTSEFVKEWKLFVIDEIGWKEELVRDETYIPKTLRDIIG